MSAVRPKRVYVAGPIALGDRMTNIRNAIDAADRLLVAGFVPFVPHLDHYWDEVHPHPVELWMQWDYEWIKQCDCLLRIPGYSVGSDKEVEFCQLHGIPVYNSLEEVIASGNGVKTQTAGGDSVTDDMAYALPHRTQLTMRPEVSAFAENMESRLRAHDHERGSGAWRQHTHESLMDRLREKVGELEMAHYPHDIARKAADVANFAMMVADRAAQVTAPQQADGEAVHESQP